MYSMYIFASVDRLRIHVWKGPCEIFSKATLKSHLTRVGQLVHLLVISCLTFIVSERLKRLTHETEELLHNQKIIKWNRIELKQQSDEPFFMFPWWFNDWRIELQGKGFLCFILLVDLGRTDKGFCLPCNKRLCCRCGCAQHEYATTAWQTQSVMRSCHCCGFSLDIGVRKYQGYVSNFLLGKKWLALLVVCRLTQVCLASSSSRTDR